MTNQPPLEQHWFEITSGGVLPQHHGWRGSAAVESGGVLPQWKVAGVIFFLATWRGFSFLAGII